MRILRRPSRPIRRRGVAAPAQPVPVAASPMAVLDLGAPTIRTDSDEEEEQEEVTEKAVRAAPPWLVSGVVHMIALILMGIIYLSANRENKVQIEAIYAETEGVQLEEDILQDPGLMDMHQHPRCRRCLSMCSRWTIPLPRHRNWTRVC